MGILRGLIASDHRQTIDFFIVGLRDVSESTVNRDELLFNASVLAHYAQVSTQAQDEFLPQPVSVLSLITSFSTRPPRGTGR